MTMTITIITTTTTPIAVIVHHLRPRPRSIVVKEPDAQPHPLPRPRLPTLPGMTTEPAPPIAVLPPLPNPAHPRNAGHMLGLNAAEALRAIRQLHDGALNGTVEYPYPTTTEYPLPPLPAVPAPSRQGASRRVRPPPAKAARPNVNPPVPASSPLAQSQSLTAAIATHNAIEPHMPASLHFGSSALLIHSPGRGFCWALLRTLGGEEDAREVECLAVRFFPTRYPKPPPVHALPPQGPAHVHSENLSSLKLSVPQLLWRLRSLSDIIDQPCFYCRKHLSDLDGLPLACSGFLPGVKTAGATASAPTGDGDKDKEKANEEKDGDKDKDGDRDKDGETEKDGDKEMKAATETDADEGEPEGRWVAWHPRCEQ